MALQDDNDLPAEYDFRDETDDCPHCNGSGYEFEGDVMVGECPSCGGSGILDT